MCTAARKHNYTIYQCNENKQTLKQDYKDGLDNRVTLFRKTLANIKTDDEELDFRKILTHLDSFLEFDSFRNMGRQYGLLTLKFHEGP